MKDKTYLIFDFDGTIADTLHYGYEICKKLAPRYNLLKMVEKDLEFYRGMNASKIIKESGISVLKLTLIIRSFRKEFSKNIQNLHPFPQIPEVLQTLSEKYTLGILTSNSETTVKAFLQQNKLENYFQFVHSESNLFGKSKVMRKLFKKYKIHPKNVVYIGDETRDIEASRAVGIRVLSVTWGFNTSTLINQFTPDFIAHTPSDILTLLSE